MPVRLFRSLPLLAALVAVDACSDPSTSPLSSQQDLLVGSPAADAKAATAQETIYGLTSDNELVVLSSNKPNQVSSTIPITGLAVGETVLGIDFRPSDLNANGIDDVGKLYGVTSANRIYVIDPATGAASSPVTLSVGLSSAVIGVGFNPVPDRLRIHTATGQNLRVNVDNGAVTVDGVLTYGAADTNFGVSPQIVATGYTNNDNDAATGTALYAIDAGTDALVTFPAGTGGPNGGVMATIGQLGVDAGEATGLDISVTSGVAYAAISTSASGKSTLYEIDLASGAVTKVGMLAQTKGALIGIAVKP